MLRPIAYHPHLCWWTFLPWVVTIWFVDNPHFSVIDTPLLLVDMLTSLVYIGCNRGAATCPFPVHGLWYSPLCIYTHTYTYTYTCTYIYIHIHIDIYTVYVYSFYYLLLLKLLSSLLVLIIYVKGSIFSIYRGVLLSTALKMFATRYCAILCSSRSQGCSWGCDWTQCSVDTRPRPWHPSWEEKTPRGDDRSKIVCFWDQKNHLCMTGFL